MPDAFALASGTVLPTRIFLAHVFGKKQDNCKKSSNCMHNNNNKNQKKRSKPVRKSAVTISLASIALAAAGFYYFASTPTAVDLTAQPPEQNAAQTSQALSAIRPADVLKRRES